ncbi:GTP 3',8-cyclase [subsurface metagenome]
MTVSIPAARMSEQQPLENVETVPTVGAGLIDQHGRVFDYLRVAVTDRCNLRCIYCMPEKGVDFTRDEELLTTAEILRVVGVAATLGVNKIRYTGGEPLLRQDILDLIASATQIPGITSIHLTTNGIHLPGKAVALREAGLDGVNISLDTLDAAKFLQITRREGVAQVLEGMRTALEAGLPSVKINVVAMRGFNDHEIEAFVNLTRDHSITVRFVELMPFDVHQIWKTGRYCGMDLIRERLEGLYPELGAATGSATEETVFQIPGHAGKVALIPAYTRPICETCNRVRLTADGQLRNCLYSTMEFDLKGVLRAGGDDEALARLLRAAMWVKFKDGWEAQHQDGGAAPRHLRESMTQIGG